MYPFQLCGNTIEIYRYSVSYTKTPTVTIPGIMEPKNMIDYVIDWDAANKIAAIVKGTIQELDTTEYEWMDGLTFDTYDDAVKAYEMGEDAYKATLSQPSDHDILMALVGNSNDPMNAAQNLGNVLQVMAAQLSTSEL